MKLETLILQNFRSFKGYHQIPISNLSVFVGANDVGKSAILEAINILLQGEYNSFDKDDICKYKIEGEECIIGGIFTSMPPDLVIDETAKTSLADESLLIKNDTLFILYKTKNTATLKPFIRTHFPSSKYYKNILDKNIDDLKEIANGLITDKAKYPYLANSKSSIRKSIRDFIKNIDKKGLELKETDISIDKEEGKSIYDKIKKYLPVYSLFQSDRKNEDQDKEAQDPLKTATKEILGTMGTELENIEKSVKEYVKKISENTLIKLREMNPELADILEPEFTKSPDWPTVFKYTLKTRDDIPLNKRGSGVRRLILLNFFRAKAEKVLEDDIKKQNRVSNDIIYAFEEPETSQHPTHQKMLIESFIELSQKSNIQILLTTHSPGIAKLLPEESLIMLRKKADNVEVLNNDPKILKEIADTLGILPNIEIENTNKVKLAICVEGKNDIQFLKNINLAIPEFKAIIDLEDEKIITLPLGGSSLQYWVNLDYLGKLNLDQVHIYDSDIGHPKKAHQYKKYVDKINSKGGNNIAYETNKREFENYIHPTLIREEWGYDITPVNWDETDIAEEIAIRNLENSESTRTWDQLADDERKKKKSNIKDNLNNGQSKNLTKDMLVELNAYDEIESWLLKIKEFLN